MTAKGKGKALSQRDDIQLIFSCYAPRGKNLSAQGLLDFIQKEQMNSQADMKAVEQIIENYEINKTVKSKKSMTFGGFLRYMKTEDCSVDNKDNKKVYRDMDWALCHYFLSSSYNTYLTGDQLVGRSHLHACVSALRRGCRCLEIDCWDGPDQEPVVYHGYTLTSKILFKEVIATIEQHAFEFRGDLPSTLTIPNPCPVWTLLVFGTWTSQVSPYPVILSLENHCTPLQQEMMAEYLKTILGEILLDMTINDIFAKELPSPEEKKIALAVALSNLVIYTKSVHFVGFKHSIANQKFYENTSLAEAKARKLAMNSVALNFQSLGEAMDLNRGKFQDNGNCGYVLKPHFMRVISGYSLLVPRGSKGIDPYVHVEIYGVSADNAKKQTNYVKQNAMSPRWDETMTFAIQVPDLALVRFIVEDQNAIMANEFIAQYTLHLTSMNQGYRWVPLLSKEGISLDPASLFIYVWFS
ncbi:1-phosphatidylinositol 4,5-bisphosphate phosphodiesterase zeta-1 [Acipenser ruthenus]|uniref:Phosphoinositide phospholipase C n=1 Tax=Acipenser ruthenus TaxID=7906 RepID=A0A662YRY5_ACIRT|nr:1-phosphatidylinositol 4,5-bisphosphate phosphodiesterase zeta-1 [Acipenser ruthenus]